MILAAGELYGVRLQAKHVPTGLECGEADGHRNESKCGGSNAIRSVIRALFVRLSDYRDLVGTRFGIHGEIDVGVLEIDIVALLGSGGILFRGEI